ncbi:hypothetical protein O3P69_010293 [Scylla paramamosain]
MVRCAQCSVWVHTENIIAHLAKGHSNNKEPKTPKMVPMGTITEVPRVTGDSMLSGTNIVIKVTGQSTPKSFSSNISKSSGNSLSKSGTVKLVTTSNSTLYQKVQNIKHSDSNGTDKVIVRKSVTNAVPMVNVGPRLVMKSLGQAGVGHLSRGHKVVQQVAQPGLNSVTGVNGVTLATTFKTAKQNQSGAQGLTSKSPLKTMVPQTNFQNIAGRSLKLVKRITNEAPKSKSVKYITSDSQNNVDIPHSTKTKEKKVLKVLSSGDASSSKNQGKKRRKQILKPSTGDVSYTDTNTTTPPPPPPPPTQPPHSEGKPKKRGRKPKLSVPDEGGSCNPPPNHKGHRKKFKETFGFDSSTPKVAKRPGKGIRGGWKKKKRGPGRPRKNQLSDTPDTSEVDSLFDEVDREDLENEPVVVAKKEEENIPTVELDLFTLPSTNEQVSVLLTEPQNPNFKVYASMDAIFVGDSALGDVTNQIGYVTDANNVVYVNPSHFLFPNVEDLENFVPSPILTMKGNKVGLTPVRKPWSLTSNKAYTPIVLKQVGVTASRDTNTSDASLEKNLEEKESPISHVAPKSRVEEHVLKVKTTQSGNKVLVKQERKTTKKVHKLAETSSQQVEVPEVKEPQIAMEMISPYTKASKKTSHKKKKRRKSGTKGDIEEETENNSSDFDGGSLLNEKQPEIKQPKDSTAATIQQILDLKNKERMAAKKSLIQKCVVKLEELKYPLKLEKPTTVSSTELPSNGETVKASEDSTAEFIDTLLTNSTVEESLLNSATAEDSVFTDASAGESLLTNMTGDDSVFANTTVEESLLTSTSTEENVFPNVTAEDSLLNSTTADNSVFTNVTTEESHLQEEIPINSPVFMPSDAEAISVSIPEENSMSNVEEQNTEEQDVLAEGTLAGAIENALPEPLAGVVESALPEPLADVVENALPEPLADVVENALPEPEIPETSDTNAPVSEVSKAVSRTIGGGLPRRMRRRRLRTKSANIVSSKTETIQEFGGGVGGGDVSSRVCSRRRVRHASENSVLPNKAEVSEQRRVPVNNQSDKSESGHSPKRKLEKVRIKVDTESPKDEKVSEQLTCPQTAQSGLDLSLNLSQEKVLSDSNENRLSLSPPGGERKRVKKHKTKHEDKETSKMESPSGEVWKPLDQSGSVCSEQSSTESDREEKPIRSVRERRPSFKLLESLSVASQSPKRSPQIKVEEQLHSPTESVPDNLGSRQAAENTALSPSHVPDSSPSREWLGRGAKLKAQVLIQDQQAGVMDSHIFPPTDSPHQTSSKNNSTDCTSPRLEVLSPSRISSLMPPSKTPSPTSSSKTQKPLIAVQNREWQARGAKLKAQVMISDPESSLVPYTSAEELTKSITSPPNKKLKLDLSPANTKDIRSFFKSGKSAVSQENTSVLSPGSPVSPRSPQTTRTPKRHAKNASDIRKYFNVTSPTIPAKKIKEENVRSSPKKLASPTSVPSENTLAGSNYEDVKPSVEAFPISEYTFEGFKRLTRQSGLRSKALLRLVSLFNTKRWHRLDKFTFPVDQLCDWNDELLSNYDFD